MQTQNPFLDEFAKLTTAAMGLAQTAGEEAKAAFRAQAERLVVEFDLVRRDEYDALKGQLQALREEIAELKVKAAADETAGATAKTTPKRTQKTTPGGSSARATQEAG